MNDSIELPELTVRATRYMVNAVPETAPDAYVFEVAVEWRSEDQWAVMWHSRCLSKSGKWDFEPLSSSRTTRWKNNHRFSFEEAMKRAKEIAPSVTVNGHVAREVARKVRNKEWPYDE